MVSGVGEVGSSGGVVDRGGRAVVEDEDDVAGLYFPRRGRLRVHGIMGSLGAGLIWWRGFRGGEFGWSPSGSGKLAAGDGGLFGGNGERGGMLGEEGEVWCFASAGGSLL